MQDFIHLPMIGAQDLAKPTWVCVRSEPHREFFAEANLQRCDFEVYCPRHEGAYDFTRFTVLGHRFLFRKFEAIDFGGNRGAEIVLAWSIRYFVWALTRSKKVARIFGVFSQALLRPFSLVLSKASLFDASSGVYFMGRKRSGHDVSHKELVALYKGQFDWV